MQLSQQRMKILRLLYGERTRAELPTLSVEGLAQELGISRGDTWDELTYLEDAGYVSIKSRQLGAIIHYTLTITRRGIDVVEALRPIQDAAVPVLVDSEKQSTITGSIQDPGTHVKSPHIPSLEIFVSHSSHDNAFCRRLVAVLWRQFPDAGIFFDEVEMQGGDDWVRRIPQELLKRSVFIVVLSEFSVASHWVQEETLLALRAAVSNHERHVIPIRYRACDPDQISPLLQSRHIIDCAHQDETIGFDQLVTVLQGLPTQ